MNKLNRIFIHLIILVSIFTQQSWAVGGAAFGNQVVGSRGFGMGNAFTGIADDPSAIYFNPAGLTQLEQTAVSYGLTLEPLESEYEAKNTNPLTGGSPDGTSASMESFTPIVPHLYLAVPGIREKWAFGFGMNSPFGLETHWSETGPLRYAATDSEILFMNFNPTVAYKVNDKISVGGGIVYGLLPKAELKKQVNNNVLDYNVSGNQAELFGSDADGSQKMTGDGDGWGYNLGLLFKPIEKHSFGVSYRSKIRTHVEGEVELTNISGIPGQFAFGGPSYTADAETDLMQPESVILGYGFRPGKWTFALDGEWIGFSDIDNTTLSFKGPNQNADTVINNPAVSVVNRDWHNTWNLGMGANYEFNDHWEGRFGFYHHPSVVPTATWDPSIPDSSKNGYTLGGSYNLPSFSVDFLYNYLVFSERTINNSNDATLGGTANGTYKTTAHIFGVTFTNRFGSK